MPIKHELVTAPNEIIPVYLTNLSFLTVGYRCFILSVFSYCFQAPAVCYLPVP